MSHIQPDPLESILRLPLSAAPTPNVYDQTVSALRRHRRRRRFKNVAVMLTVYAAGMLTLMICMPPPQEPPETSWARPTQVKRNELVDELPRASPRDLEWHAVEHPKQAAEMYRQAGNKYLEQNDLSDAVRTYGHALDESKDANKLDISVNDSWLMMMIKNARKKEAKR